MRVLKNEDFAGVSMGDSWAGTPEGRSTVDGAGGPTGGKLLGETCYTLPLSMNGVEYEFCAQIKTAKSK
jgi:hypothetical protein